MNTVFINNRARKSNFFTSFISSIQVIVIFGPFLIILMGCMGTTYSKQQLKTDFNDLQLCQAAIFHGIGSVQNTEDVVAEINRRGLISEKEWQLVKASTPQSRKLKVGMSECSMLMVMDSNSYEVTESVSEFGVSRLYEYGHYGHGPFIFVDNGKVSSWTN